MRTTLQSVEPTIADQIHLIKDSARACDRYARTTPIEPEFGGAIRRTSAYTKRPV